MFLNFAIFLVILANGFANTSPYNLAISIPQLLLVLYCILTKRYANAIIFHFVFFVTSFSFFSHSNEFSESIGMVSYNYAKLRIIGPITFSHVVIILLASLVNIQYKGNIFKNRLFGSFYKLSIYLIVTGFGIGILGFSTGGYYWQGLLNYGGYILVLFIHSSILIGINDPIFKCKFAKITICLLAIDPIAQSILHFSLPEMNNSTGISFFSILLLPSLFFQKNIFLNLFGLTCLFCNMVLWGTGGKSLILILLAIVGTFYLSFDINIKKAYPFRAYLIRALLFLTLILIPFIAEYISYRLGGSSFLVSKIHQVRTLFEFVIGRSDLFEIAPSPYVRVASLVNIIYDGLFNPIFLLFGRGYGGFFEDNLNFFSGLDLSGGAFSDLAISSGRFYSGHDTIVTVPMFNGLIGLGLLLKVVWNYILRFRNNFLAFGAVPFLLLVFYFNTLIGVFGVLLLYLGCDKFLNLNQEPKVGKALHYEVGIFG